MSTATPAAVIAGRFVLELEAGAGGMGTVYRARDLASGATVALKLLAAVSPSDAARFAREAALLAELVHPNIVRYIAHGTAADGRRYLAMEWLEGQHLAARVAAAPLDVAETVDVLQQAAGALALAHARGIVHRDVKPENLFLTGAAAPAAGAAATGRLKLLDFGIARAAAAGPRLTQTGAMIGTPSYLAPEIIKGVRDVDARADVFALGCVAFFCLTGRSPFDADDVGAVLARIVLTDAPRLADLLPGAPLELSDLVAAMLARDPAARPADGAAVLVRLTALPCGAGGPGIAAPRLAHGLTRREQRIACVVMARAPSGASEALVGQLRPLGVEPHFLADGTLVLSPGAIKAADQAAVAARAALAIVAGDAGAAVAVCTGAGEFASLAAPSGGVVDSAARRLRGTPPGKISFDDMTAALVEGRFELDRVAADPGPGAGLDGWLLRAPRASVPRPGSVLGRATPFVGRARELGLLTGTFVTAATEALACALVVVGAPGSGKSRLLRELFAWIDARPDDERPEILLGAGDPLASGSPFAVLGQVLRRAAGIADGDGADERRAKLAARVARTIAAPERARVASFLGELCGVAFADGYEPSLRAARASPQQMSDSLRRAWEDWLTAECAARPVLLCVEDLHQADAASVALIDLALRRLKDAPFLVVALARPEIGEAFPELWAAREVQTLRLGPLSRKASEALVRDGLGAAMAPQALSALAERADGNPFFLEELIRAARAGRSDALPDSIMGIVQARLDAEGPIAKRILRAASVFGERFARAGVTALLGGGSHPDEDLSVWLGRLAERELVARAPGQAGADVDVDAGAGADARPGRGDLYLFSHQLVREAAYAMLTAEDRELGHRLAGQYLEGDEFGDPMIVAEHFRRGGAPDRAVRWYDRAAAQALGANQLTVAIERAALGLDALALAGRAPPGGGAVVVAGAGGGATAGTLRLTRAEAHLWRGEYAAAAADAAEALSSLAAGTVPWLRAATHAIVAAGKQGRLDDIEARVADTSMVMIDPDGRDPFITCLAFASIFLMFGGRMAAADPLLGLLDDLAGDGQLIEPQALALVHQARAVRASVCSDLGACLGSIEASLAAFERAGDARNACTARANLGFIYAELGDGARAEEVLREALAAADRMELADVSAIILHNLGRVLGVRGDHGEAERIERQALARLEQQGDPRMLGLARIYLAEILIAAGRPADGEEEASGVVAQRDIAPGLRVRALAALAHARLTAGRAADAMLAAAQAHAELDTLGGVDEGEAVIRLRFAECLAGEGRAVEARAAIARARDCLLARAARIGSETWRQRFLDEVPENARTLALARAWTGEAAGAEAPRA